MTGPVEAYMIHDYAEARRRLRNGFSGTTTVNLQPQITMLEAEIKSIRTELQALHLKFDNIAPRSTHPSKPPVGPVHLIIDMVCKHESFEKSQVLGNRKKADVTLARQIAFWLACECTGQSLPAIARVFRRDHTTVIHGRDKIEMLIQEDAGLRRRLDWYIGQFKHMTENKES